MKNDWVMPIIVLAHYCSWPILCQFIAILTKCFEIWTSNFFCPLFDRLRYTNQVWSQSLKWPYLKFPFCPCVIHQKDLSPKSKKTRFSDFSGDRIANLGLIDFQLGLYIKVNVENKFEVHISKHLAIFAQNRPDATFGQEN